MKDKLRIVFMGTPEFAVGILDALLHSKHDVVGVVTVVVEAIVLVFDIVIIVVLLVPVRVLC